MQRTGLTDASLRALATAPTRLRELYLSGNTFTPAGMGALRTWLLLSQSALRCLVLPQCNACDVFKGCACRVSFA